MLLLPVTAFLACTFISPKDFTARQDHDGDGFVAKQYGGDDCDDSETTINPAALEVCNGIDDDCDGTADDDDADDAPSWYADADHDGYGNATTTACEQPDGYVSVGGDCNDGDAGINPSTPEAWYDGTDQDCDGNDGDQDGDGDDALVVGGEDCDDTDPAIAPGATEIWYDGVDQDCSTGSDYDQDADGVELSADCDDTDPTIYPNAPDAWYDGTDANCDGADDFDAGADGFDDESTGGDDCDDADAAIYPDAPEACDSVDQDCDGELADDESVGFGPHQFRRDLSLIRLHLGRDGPELVDHDRARRHRGGSHRTAVCPRRPRR